MAGRRAFAGAEAWCGVRQLDRNLHEDGDLQGGAGPPAVRSGPTISPLRAQVHRASRISGPADAVPLGRTGRFCPAACEPPLRRRWRRIVGMVAPGNRRPGRWERQAWGLDAGPCHAVPRAEAMAVKLAGHRGTGARRSPWRCSAAVPMIPPIAMAFGTATGTAAPFTPVMPAPTSIGRPFAPDGDVRPSCRPDGTSPYEIPGRPEARRTASRAAAPAGRPAIGAKLLATYAARSATDPCATRQIKVVDCRS